MSKGTKGKLSLAGLSLMIFTTVYGFGNIPVASTKWATELFHGISSEQFYSSSPLLLWSLKWFCFQK